MKKTFIIIVVLLIPLTYTYGSSTGGSSYTGDGVYTGNYASTSGRASTGGSSDTTPPTNTYIFINKKASITNSPTVSLELLAIGATSVMVSDDMYFKYDIWKPYTYNSIWTFKDKTNGVKTLYAKFKDDADNESIPVSASITLANNTPNLRGKTFYFSNTLTPKSPKQSIKNMQIALNMDLNTAINPPLKVDGIWGKSTTEALILFQKKYLIIADGKAGWTTRARLNQVIIQ